MLWVLSRWSSKQTTHSLSLRLTRYLEKDHVNLAYNLYFSRFHDHIMTKEMADIRQISYQLHPRTPLLYLETTVSGLYYSAVEARQTLAHFIEINAVLNLGVRGRIPTYLTHTIFRYYLRHLQDAERDH